MLIHTLTMSLVLAVATPFGMQQETGLEQAIRLYQAQQYPEAERLLRPLLEQDAANPMVHYYLGLSLLELQRFGEAEEQFGNAADQPPPSDQIQVGLARAFLGMKRYDAAEQALVEAERTNPDNPEVYLYRGNLLMERQDYGAAVGVLERAISLDPTRAYAHYYAGISYSNIKRPDKMVEHFQYFLKLAPEAPEAAKVKAVLRTVR